MLDLVKEKKAHGITMELVTVTPEIAQAWLDKNKNNRKPNARYVAQFARDIKNKDWVITGDPIKFDTNGNLIDGQHRLLACIQAKKPFETFVCYSLAINAKDCVDTGKNRSAKDVLIMHGLTNSGAVASTLKLLMNERTGNLRGTHTHTELLDALKKHPELPLWVRPPGAFPRGISLPLVGYVSYVAGHILGHKRRVGDMIEVLKTGVPNYDGDPIQKYRERIIRSRDENLGNIRARDTVVWTFKHAFNLFLKKKEIDRIFWLKEDVDLIGLDKSLL